MSESYRKGIVGFWGSVNGRLVERGEESVSALEAQLLYERAIERAVDKVVMDRAGWLARPAPVIKKAPRLSLVN